MIVDFSPPDISEEEISAVAEVLRSGWITTGPVTKRFEHEIEAYLGAERCACLASATAALELSLRMLDIGPGDEVITCAYTFTASASVIAHVGAKIVMVDCEKDAPFIDMDKIGDAITERTKAIIPVDIAGIPVDYKRLNAIVEAKKALFKPSGRMQRELGRIAIIADCAHDFGSKLDGICIPQYADFSCFSFHAVKSLTTAEGGAVCFGSIGSITAEEIYKHFMLLSLHGETKDALTKTKAGSWEYDVPLPGYKANMTDIMAAIGSVQLKRFPGIIARRFEIAKMYENGLKDNPRIILPEYENERIWAIPYVYFIRIKGASVEERNDIITKLAEEGIRANVHFKPLPLMTGYAKMGFEIGDYPNAYDFYHNEISLPFNTVITDEQVRFVIETLNRIC
ncbi:MAG: DegT/DnrJ/EryC1/StrS family aminotransferase [Oscillospiraceae bacterium]|nr:DegT/DnrJ/EryC1/StrS family aminotransferase [Oscillospiraceae bacterium]